MRKLDLIQLDSDIEQIISCIASERSKLLSNDLAKKAKVSSQFLVDTCRRHTQPNLKNAMKVLQVLGYTLEVKKLT